MEETFVYRGRVVLARTFPRSFGKSWAWSYSLDGAPPVPSRRKPHPTEGLALEEAHAKAVEDIDAAEAASARS